VSAALDLTRLRGHLNDWIGGVHDGDLPIDNNWIENRIRPVTLGRSNWLFADSLRAGRRAAVIMSLIQSAKLNGHDPYAYLKDVLERLPTHPASRIDEASAALLAASRKLMMILIQLLGVYGIGMGAYVIYKRQLRYGWRGRPATGSVVGLPAVVIGILLVVFGICMLTKPGMFASH
jgi:hypothetical protein